MDEDFISKTCIKCHSEKNLDLFPIDRQNADGHKNTCRECDNTRRRNAEKPIVSISRNNDKSAVFYKSLNELRECENFIKTHIFDPRFLKLTENDNEIMTKLGQEMKEKVEKFLEEACNVKCVRSCVFTIDRNLFPINKQFGVISSTIRSYLSLYLVNIRQKIGVTIKVIEKDPDTIQVELSDSIILTKEEINTFISEHIEPLNISAPLTEEISILYDNYNIEFFKEIYEIRAKFALEKNLTECNFPSIDYRHEDNIIVFKFPKPIRLEQNEIDQFKLDVIEIMQRKYIKIDGELVLDDLDD
jgi:hypothetical protein